MPAGPILTPLSELRFGAIATCAEGTLTLAPTGLRSATGGVVPLSSQPGTPATVQLRLPPGQPVHVVLPQQIQLRAPGHFAHVMVADQFTTSLPAFVDGGSGGSQVLAIGATLHVGADQPPGQYTGSITVILDNY